MARRVGGAQTGPRARSWTSGVNMWVLGLLGVWCLGVGVRGQYHYGYGQRQQQQRLDASQDQVDLGRTSRCYDDVGHPQKCVPEFVNAAFNLLADVTNTCGETRPQRYCLQTGGYGSRKSCDICNAAIPDLDHPPKFLTDFNNNANQTWWQSETMFEGIQYPNQVNITLNLMKAFDITYVRLFFRSPRPESFAILKRTSEDSEWVPYQYYSGSCRDTYGIPDSTYVRREDETRALCTSEFSDISPLTGGNVAFSTLEGRPSAFTFENSTELQEWVTATDIRIMLDRLNTFRDEVFGDPEVLKSYFYAITDFAVGGRCKCNGHASECVESTGLYGDRRLVCRCEHNTMGPDCGQCLPFYNDAPWGRATSSNAHECQACSCNGYSNNCYFDQDLYERTGHGGHCLDCAANRAGPNCERCKENYYDREDGVCIPCNCNDVGSRSLQCATDGTCQCKPGVTGDKCDSCAENYFDFGPQDRVFGIEGCKPCGCQVAGSRNNEASCDPSTGVCVCKEHVEGQQCDQCKPGYFNLDLENDFGCTPCFCYGHSSLCSSADDYSRGVEAAVRNITEEEDLDERQEEEQQDKETGEMTSQQLTDILALAINMKNVINEYDQDEARRTQSIEGIMKSVNIYKEILNKHRNAVKQASITSSLISHQQPQNVSSGEEEEENVNDVKVMLQNDPIDLGHAYEGFVLQGPTP